MSVVAQPRRRKTYTVARPRRCWLSQPLRALLECLARPDEELEGESCCVSCTALASQRAAGLAHALCAMHSFSALVCMRALACHRLHGARSAVARGCKVYIMSFARCRDFEELALREYQRQGKTYGLEKFWAFHSYHGFPKGSALEMHSEVCARVQSAASLVACCRCSVSAICVLVSVAILVQGFVAFRGAADD